MSSLAMSGVAGSDAPTVHGGGRDYIGIILDLMAEKDTAQRSLAQKTGISKTRIALLLHRNPKKRSRMTVDEFDSIFRALGTNIVAALMRAEALRALDPSDRARYDGVVALVCDMAMGLGQKLVDALEEIGGLDGSEVRKEWATVLQKGVIEDVSKAVAKIMERRALIAERDELWR